MLQICILIVGILVEIQGCQQCYEGVETLIEVLQSPDLVQVQVGIAISTVCPLFPQIRSCAKLTHDVWPALLQAQFSEALTKKVCDTSTSACGSDKYFSNNTVIRKRSEIILCIVKDMEKYYVSKTK